MDFLEKIYESRHILREKNKKKLEMAYFRQWVPVGL
jgi:hypothetical protein